MITTNAQAIDILTQCRMLRNSIDELEKQAKKFLGIDNPITENHLRLVKDTKQE